MKTFNRTTIEEVAAVEIVRDPVPCEPDFILDDFSFFHWHSRYEMHSQAQRIDAVANSKIAEEARDRGLVIWVPLTFTDHGVSHLGLHRVVDLSFKGWTYGYVGFIGCTKEQWESIRPDLEPSSSEAEDLFVNQVSWRLEALNAWHNGDCYGIVWRVPDEDEDDGFREDSCWGFYGLDKDGMKEHLPGDLVQYFDEAVEALE